MSVAGVRTELVAVLEESLRLLQRLTQDARNPATPPPQLVAQVSALERLDDRRDQLITELRRATSQNVRATRPGSTVRQNVLAALSELGWPQNAGFLEQYLWATRQLQVDSRAFAPLRRDEQRAWRRVCGPHRAHVAPALNPDGTANPRWLTSSAWDLQRRIVVSERTEHLFDLQKVLSLAGSSPDGDAAGRLRGPLDALLEQYASQVLAMGSPPPLADDTEAGEWRSRVCRAATAQIRAIRSGEAALREEIAARLAGLPEHDRIWGRPPPL